SRLSMLREAPRYIPPRSWMGSPGCTRPKPHASAVLRFHGRRMPPSPDGSASGRKPRRAGPATRTPAGAASLAAQCVQIFQTDQHVARLGPVRRAENPRLLQLIDDARRASVADAHAPLQQRGRAELVLDAHLRGLAEERVPLARLAPPSPGPRP